MQHKRQLSCNCVQRSTSVTLLYLPAPAMASDCLANSRLTPAIHQNMIAAIVAATTTATVAAAAIAVVAAAMIPCSGPGLDCMGPL